MKRRRSRSSSAKSFFYKHAGWGYAPGKETKAQGRRRGAKLLAHAEKEAERRGWRVEWEDEISPDLSWMDDDERAESHEVLTAVLRDENGGVLASLGNITEPDRNYGRVVEAELALEALDRA